LLSADPVPISSIREKAKRFEQVWQENYHAVNRTAFVLAVMALVGMLFSGLAVASPIAITWLFFLYNALVTSAFAEPNYRYHFFVLPMLFILAGIGAGVIAAAINNAFVEGRKVFTVASWNGGTPAGSLKSTAPVLEQLSTEQRIAWLAIAFTAGCVAVGWVYILRLQTGTSA
jgi:hypothetical protein